MFHDDRERATPVKSRPYKPKKFGYSYLFVGWNFGKRRRMKRRNSKWFESEKQRDQSLDRALLNPDGVRTDFRKETR